jgi:hypothetical protein
MTMTPWMTGTPGPTPTMTPWMTGTHGPMPSMTSMMTPMMTTTPWPGATPGGGDQIPPVGSVLINDGAEVTASPVVTLTLAATDNPGGTGVAWMYIREWGWDHDHGWHDMHQGGHPGGMGHMMGGWQPFAPTVVWEFSPEPGVKYLSVWFADAAWNVGAPAMAMINLVPDGAAINGGRVHQYRHFMHAGQPMTVRLHPQVGDPDVYVWMPGNAGPPDWWSNAISSDEQVAFVAPMDGLYLIEVHGYSDSIYDLNMTLGTNLRVASLSQGKPLPSAPLVVDAPDTTAAPLSGFRAYLPILLREP